MNQYWYRLNHYIKLYLFGDDDHHVSSEENTGKIRHHKSIREAGAQLKNEALPMEKRVEAAHLLGVLAYTGGYEGGTVAADYIPAMVELLPQQDVCDKLMVTLLQGLSSVCYDHQDNQELACKLGVSTALPGILTHGSPHSLLVKQWACYLMDVLCAENEPNTRVFAAAHGLEGSLEAMAAQDWERWPKNHAAALLEALGNFWPTDRDNMEGPHKMEEEEGEACGSTPHTYT